MNITLERLQHTDINLLRELRNANADAFFDDTYITREMQEDWWYRLQFDHFTDFYTIYLNKVTPVGFLSVRKLLSTIWAYERMPVQKACEIGHLLLAPAFRHRGIMARAITEVRRLYDPLTFWVAHVKAGNAASLALFERQGFVAIKGKSLCRSSSATKRTNTKPSSLGCSATSKAR